MTMPIDPNKMTPSTTPSSQPALPPSGSDKDRFRSAYQQDDRRGAEDNKRAGDTERPEGKEGGDTKPQDTKQVTERERKQDSSSKQEASSKQGEGPFSALGRLASKEEKKMAGDAEAVSSMAQSLQDALLKSMGGASVASAQSGKPTSDASRAEAAQLAMQMVDRMLINDPQFSGKTGARLTLGGDVNPNLKGVEVVINTQKTDAGTNLSIEFVAKTPETANYIRHNLEALDSRLKQDLASFSDIRVDIQSQGGETGREGRSKGEYIAPEEEKQ